MPRQRQTRRGPSADADPRCSSPTGGHRKECQQDPTHQPNAQTSVNIRGGRERRPDPTVSRHLVVYFNQPNNSTRVT